jgi:hypothetical protein
VPTSRWPSCWTRSTDGVPRGHHEPRNVSYNLNLIQGIQSRLRPSIADQRREKSQAALRRWHWAILHLPIALLSSSPARSPLPYIALAKVDRYSSLRSLEHTEGQPRLLPGSMTDRGHSSSFSLMCIMACEYLFNRE